VAAADDVGELAAWLRLMSCVGLGRQQQRKILAHYGSPQALFAASGTERRRRLGEEAAQALEAIDEATAQRDLARVLEWLQGAGQRDWLALGDARYPEPLLQIADPPLLLYLQGRTELLTQRSIAIVGSRNPTAQGADNARAFAEALARAGYTIVSGLALGIDAAAHVGALAGGTTIAVIGTGPDIVYPRANRDLAARVAESGLIVSEFPIGTAPLQQNFPQRNRIIAGLAEGTLVVEAALQSGSLITAAQAADAGREVFAIPGSIHSPQSRGCHALIKRGAKLVETAQDVLDELGGLFPASAAKVGNTASSVPADPLLEALGYEPTSLDLLLERTGLPTGALSARLLELELQGDVARLPGGLYQRRAAG
jgi:DNA processing protein